MKRIFILFFFILPLSLKAANFKQFERWQTENGATVIFYPVKEVPILNIAVAFAAGSAYDGENFGLSQLTGSLLNQGSANFGATEIAEKLADSGGQIDVEVTRDMATIQLKTLTEEKALAGAMDVFDLMLTKPRFSQESLNQIKSQQLMQISQKEEAPDEIAGLLFFKNLYKNHPYGHPTYGLKDTVLRLAPWQVRGFYKKYYVASNMTIVLVGAIDREKAEALAQRLSQGLAKGEKAPPVTKAKPLAQAEKVFQDFPSSQTVIRLGQLGIDYKDKAYFPLVLGNYILGGGSLVSRLAIEIREKQGLTYNVSSQLLPLPAGGFFVIGLSTKNAQTAHALNNVKTILEQFIKEGPSEQELVAGKKYLIGSFPQSLASNQQIAIMLLRLAFYNLPKDYLDTYTAKIEAVTLDEIKTAFAQLVHPDKLLEVTVGKA